MLVGTFCMDFAEAIEFSKTFRSCHPKIFKGFIEWGSWETETEGYVVLTNAASTKNTCLKQLEEYVKNHKLRKANLKTYLMICTL